MYYLSQNTEKQNNFQKNLGARKSKDFVCKIDNQISPWFTGQNSMRSTQYSNLVWQTCIFSCFIYFLPLCIVLTLWLDFFEDDLEWVDASGMLSSPAANDFSTAGFAVTATAGWVDAEVDPETKYSSYLKIYWFEMEIELKLE